MARDMLQVACTAHLITNLTLHPQELGALKHGTAADGSAWRETWTEKMYVESSTLELNIQRSAHKWARDAAADEWEEKWGEAYTAGGRTNKYADKVGRASFACSTILADWDVFDLLIARNIR